LPTLSHFREGKRFNCMNPESHPLAEIVAPTGSPDAGELFHLHYPRIARVIARIVNDPGRAEELAADVLWKFLRSSRAHHANPGGWLYRAGIRRAIDELRRQQRRDRLERLFPFLGTVPSPEQLHNEAQDQQQVRCVLAALKHRDSELLILRSEGLSYEETAEILGVSDTSIGTLLRRAQDAFRKEYIKRYGQPNF
jgi:RNA polymerase sigma-70 factor (ECF subfamily)